MSDNLNFDDLTPIEIPFSYRGKDYILREATGDAACQYRNAVATATQLADGKVSGIKNMADTEPFLVALCVRELLGDGKERVVTGVVVRSWPARVQRRLFKKIQEISELDEADLKELYRERDELDKRIAEMKKDTAKNEQSCTEDG